MKKLKVAITLLLSAMLVCTAPIGHLGTVAFAAKWNRNAGRNAASVARSKTRQITSVKTTHSSHATTPAPTIEDIANNTNGKIENSKSGWRVYLQELDANVGPGGGGEIRGVIDILCSIKGTALVEDHGLGTRIGDAQVAFGSTDMGGKMISAAALDLGGTVPSPFANKLDDWLSAKVGGKPRYVKLAQTQFGVDMEHCPSGKVYVLWAEPIIWGAVPTGDPIYKYYDYFFYGTYFNWMDMLNALGVDKNNIPAEMQTTLLLKAAKFATLVQPTPADLASDTEWQDYYKYALQANNITGVDADHAVVMSPNETGINFNNGSGNAWGLNCWLCSPIQSTANEGGIEPGGPGPSNPSLPHPPPEESSGIWKIRKTYRTVKYRATGDIETQREDGFFRDNDCTNIIEVEDEQALNGYKLIAWATSNVDTHPPFEKGAWEADRYNSGVQKGLTPKKVTMPIQNQATENILYVLLEKEELLPLIPPGCDYAVTESMLSRDITLRYTDSGEYKGYFTASSDENAHKTTSTVRTIASHVDILNGAKFRWHKDQITCPGHVYCTQKHQPNTAGEGEPSNEKPRLTETKYCYWHWLGDPFPLKLGIKNSRFSSYDKVILTAFGQFMAGAKSLDPTNSDGLQKWHQWRKPEVGQNVYRQVPYEQAKDDGPTAEKAGHANYNTDQDEWMYKMVIHRGKDKLTLPQFKGGDQTIHNANGSCYNIANSPAVGEIADYTENFQVGFVDNSHLKTVTIQASMKDDMGASSLGPDAEGNMIGPCSPRSVTAIIDGTFNYGFKEFVQVYHGRDGVDAMFQYAGGSGATNTAVHLNTLHKDDDKASHKLGSGISKWDSNSYWKHDSGNQTEGMNVSFYPYVQMWYEKLLKKNYEPDPFSPNYDMTSLTLSLPYQNQTSQSATYILGRHTRSVEAYNFAEILWGKAYSESDPNLKLESDQWSTHATAQADLAAITQVGGQDKTILPGGAIIRCGAPGSNGHQKVKLVTFQVMPSNQAQNAAVGANTVYDAGGTATGGLDQVKATGSGTFLDDTAQIPDTMKDAHYDYVNSFIELFEKKNLEHWEHKNPNSSPFDGVKVYNDPVVSNIDSLDTNDEGNKKSSEEEKYYFKLDASESSAGTCYDRSQERSQESDLDVRITGVTNQSEEHDVENHTSTGIYVTWADVRGNVYQKTTGIASGKEALIDERTKAYTNLLRATERRTGYDTTKAGKSNNGTPNWYSEAFDGIAVVVQETELEVTLQYPNYRDQVYDPKLTAPNKGGQRNIFSGEVNSGGALSTPSDADIRKNYRVAAFRSNPYPNPDPQSSDYINQSGEFAGATGGSTKVFSYDLENMFVSRRFYIPSATTQDLR